MIRRLLFKRSSLLFLETPSTLCGRRGFFVADTTICGGRLIPETPILLLPPASLALGMGLDWVDGVI